MPSPQFATNGNVRFGSLGTLRCTTEISVERTSNGKVTATTTGEVGFSSGIRLASLSMNVACQIGSAQQKRLVQLFENQIPDTYDFFDGNQRHTGVGIFDSLSISSKTNELIEYSLKFSAADGKSQ